ncbi:MAG: HAMP domain-containing protein [Deltaproteobacteria bacterium]|nr:HAMP domain-containing protein [Deltaproteobacteria bacterium]
MKLAPKLTILFLLLSIVPIAIVGYLAYDNGRRTIVQETIDHLVSINIFKNNELIRWIENNKSDIEELAQRFLVRQYASVLAKHEAPDPAYHRAKGNIIEEHLKPRLKYGGFFELFLMCPRHGLISASTDEKQEGKYRDTYPYFIEGKSRTHIQGIYYSPSLEKPAMTISTPIKDKQGNLMGVVGGRLDLGELSKIIGLQTGTSPTEDTYLVNTFNFFVTEPRFAQDYALKKAVRTEGVDAGLSGKDGVGFYKNYRGEPVIGAYKWLPEFKICIITEVDQAEAFASVVHLAWVIAGIASAISIAVVFLGLFFARTITRPVRQLAEGAEEIGGGNLEHRVGTASKDKIGGLSRAFDRMSENLKAIMVSRDELEQRVRDRTAQLEAANKELEAFSYSVSHDLRAPLRAIDGFSRVIMEDYTGKLDAEGKRYLNIIRSNTQKMAQLIDDLLLFSRLGRQEIRISDIDMVKMAKTVSKELKPAAHERKTGFNINELPPFHGDQAMIRQVLINLPSNAVKFTRPKENATIEVGGCTDENENIYYVNDNGVEFDMQYVNKLFGVFQRLHSSEEFEGTGVGLAIVQRIIHRHGGKVWAEGKVGEGATFYFVLPRGMRDEG